MPFPQKAAVFLNGATRRRYAPSATHCITVVSVSMSLARFCRPEDGTAVRIIDTSALFMHGVAAIQALADEHFSHAAVVGADVAEGARRNETTAELRVMRYGAGVDTATKQCAGPHAPQPRALRVHTANSYLYPGSNSTSW